MQVLIPYPLQSGHVEVKTLPIGTGFLRVAGPNNATQPDFWILAQKDTDTPTIEMFSPTTGAYLKGVANNTPVVPTKATVLVTPN